MARAWALLGQEKEAMAIINAMWKNSIQYLRWYCGLSGMRFESAQTDFLMHFYILQQLMALGETTDQKWADEHYKELSAIASFFEGKGGRLYQD